MRIPKRLRTAVLTLGILALAGCTVSTTPSPRPSTAAPSVGPSAAASPTTPAVVTLKYGLPVSAPTLDTVGVYFAIEKGFFTEQGLKVEVTGYARATAIRAMLSGSADLIEIDSGSALLAWINGAPLKFVNMPIPGALDVVIAKPEIKGIQDAVGKKWATSGPGSQGQVFAEAMLKSRNIDPARVTFVPVGSPADRARALLAGQVDITSMTIVTNQQILDEVSKGTISVIGTIAKELPNYINIFDAVSDPFLAKSPELVQKFIIAEMKGYRWASQNLDEASTIAAKYIPDTKATLTRAGLKRMVDEKIYNYNSFTVDQVAQSIKFLTDTKLITGAVKAEDVTVTKFADEMVKSLGTFSGP